MPDIGIADALSRLGFVEIIREMGVAIDIRYATANNFLGYDLYGGFDRLYLHRIAADQLVRAIDELKQRKPGWTLLVFDGLRPNRFQRLMWSAVRGTRQQSYVADPAVGSIHGYGLAVDASLADDRGQEVDMGTAFDAFTPLSEPQHEAAFMARGELTTKQVENRGLLRSVMTTAGFCDLPIEWWHFDAMPPAEVRGRFRLVE